MSHPIERLNKAMALSNAQSKHAMIRIQSQLEFGEDLCALHPREALAWRKLMDQAAQRVEAAANEGPDGFMAAVIEAENGLTPLAEIAKTYTVYCVGHAHMDMNWMWSWPETVSATHDSFLTVLRLMKEFPDFRFTQSQASCYAIIERHHPEMLKEIAERIENGQWEVAASHWVEGDKNIANGESLCRHVLYTRQYMKKLFGLKPEDVVIDWSPDTFGHAVTVPTYLVRGGIKYLYMHRPGGQGPKRPTAFWWQAPDGSRVLVRNDMRLGYNGEIQPSMVKDLVLASQETGLRFVMYVYGVGDHGGGPTRRDVLYSREMNVWPVFPKIQLSGAQVFFDRLAKEGAGLPTLDCELNYEFTGCYTTQTVVKRANRFGEKKLLDVEAAATLASRVANSPYPKEELLEAWRDTLFNHFHDILPGSGVHDTRTYTHGLYQKTVATTSMEETQALRTLASKVDTTGPDLPVSLDMPVSSLMTAMGSGVGFGSVDGGLSSAEQSAGQGPRPILVFNPTAMERKEVVEVVVWDNAWGWRRQELRGLPFSVRTPKGDLIPAQTLDVGHYWGHDFVRLAFPVTVGSLGYGVYTVIEGSAQGQESQVKHLGIGHHCSYAFYERSPEGLENEWLRLEVNPATAGIQSLIHKPSGKSIICSCDEAPVLEYAMERPHGMTAWTVDHTGPTERLEVLSLSRRQAGPYKAFLEARMRIRESEFSLTYELRKEDPNLYIHIDGTWFERGSHHKGIPVLRAAFPFALEDIRTRYEIPFGGIERNTEHGEEVPALRWAEVSGLQGDEPMGCLLLNDSKHGHSIDGNRLRLTLIRSSYDPDPLPEIGRHEIHLALRPFEGAMSDAEAIRIGQAFNHELRCVSTDVHKGRLSKAASLVRVSPSVVVSGIKMAEEDRSLVLRVFEPNGKAVTAKIDLDREALGEVQKAQEVDLMERPLAQSSAEVKSPGCVTVKVSSRGISSIKIKMK